MVEVKFKDINENVLVGYAVIEGIKIEKANDRVKARFKLAEGSTRKNITLEKLEEMPETQAYRDLYWAYKMDPTKWRPSAEALIRRIVGGKKLWVINNVVDLMNAISIESKMSIGLHDMRKIKSPLSVRIAEKTEKFEPIGSKKAKNLRGHELLVSDKEKPIDLAFSTSSSDLTKVTAKTKDVLVVVYAPGYFSKKDVMKTTKTCADDIASMCGGKVKEADVAVNKGKTVKKEKEEEETEKEDTLGLTVKKTEDFSEWYNQVVLKGELADFTGIKGFMAIKPDGYAMWEKIQGYLDARFKETGHKNTYFPAVIPENLLKKEKEHIEGFSPEAFWITHEGPNKIEERLALRPTSETIIYDSYSKWVRSWRDLPLLYNCWNSVFRYETKMTKLFLRTREFLWQEGHTVHATKEGADKEVLQQLEIYKDLVEKLLAIPVVIGRKTDDEKFAGALYTTTLEALMPDGRALQMGTSHNLGQHFSTAFNIRFLDKNEEMQHAWQTSWGVSTRLIGAVVMVHGDDKGLVLPPRIAPIHAVIVPIVFEKEKDDVIEKCREIYAELQDDFSVELDARDNYTPGWKFNYWELRGAPIRIEVGPTDLAKGEAILVRRDTGEKINAKYDDVPGKVRALLEKIQADMYKRAKKRQNENTRIAKDYSEFCDIIENKRGFVKAYWCGSPECEAKIHEETTATIRCAPFGEKSKPGKCVLCGEDADSMVYFAKNY